VDEPSSHHERPVLSIGEILIDIIVDDGETSLESAREFVARSGGAPANTAVALARLGVPSAFCGVVGKDPFGSRLKAKLTREGVNATSLEETDREPTTLAFAWKDARGDGHFWLLRGADALLSPQQIQRANIEMYAALIVGSVALAADPSRSAIQLAVHEANKAKVPVFFDVNLRPMLWSEPDTAADLCFDIAQKCDVVKLSLDDARGLMGPESTAEVAIKHFLALGPRFVVLTDGERGSWYASRQQSEQRFVPAFSVDAVEPTGAGDAFSAALIARFLANSWQPPADDDIRYAAAAGALATTRRGAWEGLPTSSELRSFLAAQ
jgi:sugar/nucleoside kinase (ribokinase family)